jgi:hypothetical protein
VENFSRLLLVCSCALTLLSSCSSNSGNGNGGLVQPPVEPLSCIIVLPASTSVDKDDTINYEEAQSLEKGAAYATEVIAGALEGNPKIRILTSEQVNSLVPEISGGITGTVSALGQKLNCDAAMLTTVLRFKQRVGTDYASDSPASADVHMVLRHVSNGTVLWSADYRETQESFLKNIFSYSKMKSRGFKWITVEQLMETGIKERLAECPYLY